MLLLLVEINRYMYVLVFPHRAATYHLELCCAVAATRLAVAVIVARRWLPWWQETWPIDTELRDVAGRGAMHRQLCQDAADDTGELESVASAHCHEHVFEASASQLVNHEFPVRGQRVQARLRM